MKHATPELRKSAQSDHRAVIIGAGIGGLGLAALLAKAGYAVTVVEKNGTLGGRARQFSQDGFTFDMGPSWYLMPDVFEHYFELLGEKVENSLNLVKLSPSYRIFADGGVIDLHSDPDRAAALFESIEPGAGAKLHRYLDASRYQYNVVMQNFMHKNFDSPLDFLTWRMVLAGTKLSAFTTMSRYVKRFFKTPLLQKIVQYQLLFLGVSPFKAPSIYNVMGHIDFNMGVFYPIGGVHAVIRALAALALKHGAVIRSGDPVIRIETRAGLASGVTLASGERLAADIVVSNADMHHTETHLLDAGQRSFPPGYWEKRQLAPSALIAYLGVDGRADSLLHHNIVFHSDWEASFAELFDGGEWPSHPSYYVCCPSRTEASMAPAGCETLFMLMPVASRLSYDGATVSRMTERMLEMAETTLGVSSLRSRILTRREFSGADFASDYNSYGGSALGLAHTLRQTALLRPGNVSRKLKNLFYVGAGTNPGVGVPICLISAQLAYKRIMGINYAQPLIG